MEGSGGLGGGAGGSAQHRSPSNADADDVLPGFDDPEAQSALEQVSEGAVRGGGDADWAEDSALLASSTSSSPMQSGYLDFNIGSPPVRGDPWGSGD